MTGKIYQISISLTQETMEPYLDYFSIIIMMMMMMVTVAKLDYDM